MKQSLGSYETIQRMNTACQLSHNLVDTAADKAEEGYINAAIELLLAAQEVEPRRIERMEIRRRIQHLERADVDWPEAFPKLATR